MIKVYYSNVENLNLTKGYSKVSTKRKYKIDSFRFEKDKKLSCGAELLLLKILNEIGIKDPIFKTQKFDKPYISNHYPEIHFNISHSKNTVLCGISDEPIGVDIEYIDSNINLEIAKSYFYNSEYKAIINSNNPKEEFFNYWVLKESHMKHTGLGLNLDLDSFEIIKRSNKDIKLNINNQIVSNIQFSLFDLNEFKVAICSKYKVKNLVEVNVNELI